MHFVFFFFNDTATTEIYTLSLHDALPILGGPQTTEVVPLHHAREALADGRAGHVDILAGEVVGSMSTCPARDRKSTRLNSSHANISYAVFCLKKKKKKYNTFYTHK